jgi:peptide-methionine (S)-S-oxide reductase
MLFGRSPKMVTPAEALPGRSDALPVPEAHFVNGASLTPPWPDHTHTAVFALGCFWGAERAFWQLPGVISTAVGYTGGFADNPTYQEVCSGRTGHTEAVLVAYDPNRISYDQLLAAFWEGHDPTQGYRQGNDVGTQYRSGIYTVDDEQLAAALASRDRFQKVLTGAGLGEITSDIEPLRDFFYAEEYHQQYLAKNPGGYCGLGGTGLSCPVGVASVDD